MSGRTKVSALPCTIYPDSFCPSPRPQASSRPHHHCTPCSSAWPFLGGLSCLYMNLRASSVRSLIVVHHPPDRLENRGPRDLSSPGEAV